jgi:hypothetical protein
MLLLRRYLALAVLFFWLGGFTFYASIVVPVGQEVFGHLRQGFVTRQVTVYLNLAGAVALICLVWDLLAVREDASWRWWGRWLLWAGMGLSLLILIRLHGQLDELLIPRGRLIRDADLFHLRHRLYLWISTAQWACGLLYLLFTLASWRSEDTRARQTNRGATEQEWYSTPRPKNAEE